MAAIQGIYFIAQERQEAWRRKAAEERRQMYARPDAPPLPEPAAPGRSSHGGSRLLDGLRHWLVGRPSTLRDEP